MNVLSRLWREGGGKFCNMGCKSVANCAGSILLTVDRGFKTWFCYLGLSASRFQGLSARVEKKHGPVALRSFCLRVAARSVCARCGPPPLRRENFLGVGCECPSGCGPCGNCPFREVVWIGSVKACFFCEQETRTFVPCVDIRYIWCIYNTMCNWYSVYHSL